MTKTALIADDDSSVRGMLKRLLRPLGWTVLEASDGYTALDKLTSQHVDLLILDQLMPQLTGTEVLSVVRGSATHADLPVVIVSGASDPQTSESMLALGVTDYLVKPLRIEFVRERLARLDKAIRSVESTRRVRDGLRDGAVLAVVDADADRRQFIEAALAHRYDVLQVPSGVAALRACVVSRPSVFVVGPDVGLMAPEFLARKLRERSELAAARLILVAGAAPEQTPAAFDGIILNTDDPEEFRRRFDEIVGPAASIEPTAAAKTG